LGVVARLILHYCEKFDKKIINAFEHSLVDLKTSLSFIEAIKEFLPPPFQQLCWLTKKFREDGNATKESTL
jgi:hypothetical protein